MLLLSEGVFAVNGQGKCARFVFDRFCLGGSFSQLLRERPANSQPMISGERAGVVYQLGREKIYVMAFQGRIYKALRTFEPSNKTTFDDLKRRMQKKYGAFQDQSHFPDYVRNRAGKIGAIRRGEGEIKNIWLPSGEAWRIELSWTRKLGISIAFIVNELDTKQRNARLEGL
jgi:hypothetical protein